VSRIVVVTGTDTGVGKTVATAVLALDARTRGTVTVVKPVQTGVEPGGVGDVDEVHRLTGCAVQEFTGLEHPLAPDVAARLAGVRIPPIEEYADRVRVLAEFHDTVIVEGAGGLLVRLDTEGGTLLDLAEKLDAEVYVVARAGLGTLNHTELTVETLRARGIEPVGLMIGAWPVEPDLAAGLNLDELPRVTGVPVRWVIPDGVGAWDRAAFEAAAPSWAH
jgi:dethiobiotin synthetase